MKTVPFSQANVPVFQCAPSNRRYHQYMQENQQRLEPEPSVAMPAQIVPYNQDELQDTNSSTTTAAAPPIMTKSDNTSNNTDSNLHHKPLSTDFCHIIESEGDTTTDEAAEIAREQIQLDGNTMPTQELLYWHYRLGHLSFHKMWDMAKQGDLPPRLANCRIPQCASCQFGKATKVPWHNKGQHTSIKTASQPGQCVSVDQLEATEPGLIAQMKGIPTKHRYRYATVFIDHYSNLSYVHLMKTLTSEETLEAKRSFESWSWDKGVRIQHYHVDNGRFVDKAFIAHATKAGQTITFCGVNAHWQNGRAEKWIRDLQEQA